jgi:hypothetical protein
MLAGAILSLAIIGIFYVNHAQLPSGRIVGQMSFVYGTKLLLGLGLMIASWTGTGDQKQLFEHHS